MIRFGIYGLLGCCGEIVWTAVVDNIEALLAGRPVDRRLMGYTYLWMLPIYGAAGLIFEIVHAAMTPWAWPLRGLTYMLLCFAMEYASGWMIQQSTGEIPWDYSDRRWQVHGLIRLDYVPVWFSVGLLFEVGESWVRVVESALRAASSQ